MLTSSAGSNRGITLLELLVAMALAGMIMAISFPSLTGGLDGVRLQSSGRRVAAFVNASRERVERDQVPVEIVIELRRLRAVSVDAKWERTSIWTKVSRSRCPRARISPAALSCCPVCRRRGCACRFGPSGGAA